MVGKEKIVVNQRIDIPESESGLGGVCNRSYYYSVKGSHIELVIKIHKLNQEIIYTGTKAKRIYYKAISDNDEARINHVKRLACESVGISFVHFRSKTRKQENVWARWMVAWYCNTFLGYKSRQIVPIVNIDNRSVLYGLSEFSVDNKIIPRIQRRWKETFINKIYQLNLHKL